jgi:hypothetical protein
MQSDYDTIVVPFIEKHADVFTEDIKAKFFSFENFRIMTAHVSTRAIDVDDYHVSAFVPFVDLCVIWSSCSMRKKRICRYSHR